MRVLVVGQVLLLRKTLSAFDASERLFAGERRSERTCLERYLLINTLLYALTFPPVVHSLVVFEIALVHEALAALSAFVRLLACCGLNLDQSS